MLEWIQTNQAFAGMAFTFFWILIPTLCGLLKKRLDESTYGHALVSAFAGAGFNGVAVLDAIKRMSAKALGIPLAVMLGFVCAFGTVAVEGCSWFRAESATIVHDVETDGSCVLSAVLAGGDPVLLCALPGVTQVVSILASLITFYDSPHVDGGIGAGLPPFRGLPSSLTNDEIAKLKAYVLTVDGGR